MLSLYNRPPLFLLLINLCLLFSHTHFQLFSKSLNLIGSIIINRWLLFLHHGKNQSHWNGCTICISDYLKNIFLSFFPLNFPFRKTAYRIFSQNMVLIFFLLAFLPSFLNPHLWEIFNLSSLQSSRNHQRIKRPNDT